MSINKSKKLGFLDYASMGAAALSSINTGAPRGMWDTLDPIYHIAGGRESAAGNAMSDAGVSLAKTGVPLLMIAGAGLKIAGGLTNWAAGYKVPTLKINNLHNLGEAIMNYTPSAVTTDDFVRQYSKMPTITLGFDKSEFKNGLFNNKGTAAYNDATTYLNNLLAYERSAKKNNADNINMNNVNTLLYNITALGGPLDGVDPSTAIGYSLYTDRFIKDKSKSTGGIANMFAGTPSSMYAFGGNTLTHGGTWSSGVTHIDAGGSHEENLNDGVQVGVDNEGVPNLVEEGEVIWDDYVFSNRLKVPYGRRGNYGKRNKYASGGKLEKGKSKEQVSYEDEVLKPFQGLTFADAAEKAEKLSGANERPTDPIALRGFLATLSILRGVQEKEREKEKLREAQEAIDNMTPEELAMLQLLMAAGQEMANQQAMQQLMQIPEGMELMIPLELLMSAYGGPIYSLGGVLDNWDNTVEPNRYDFGSWLLRINPALYEKLGTDDEIDPRIQQLLEFYQLATDNTGTSEGLSWNEKVKVNVPDFNIRSKAFEDLTPLDINTIFGWLETPASPNDLLLTPELLAELDLQIIDSANYVENQLAEQPVLETPIVEDNNTIEGPLQEVLKANNMSSKDWNELSERKLNRLIKLYKSSLGSKKNAQNFQDRLDSYNLLLELKNRVSDYQNKLRDSYLTLEDIKDFDYNNLERIAKVVNPNYVNKDIKNLSVDDEKKTILELKDNIVKWSNDNKVTVGNINDAFATPTAHNSWARTSLDDETRWTPSGYDYDEFKNRTANYKGSLTPGNLAGNYAPDANFDLGDFLDVNALEADQSYKDYTDRVEKAIERNKDVRWRHTDKENPSYSTLEYAEGSPTFTEDDYNLLRLLSRLVERTKTNPDGEYVPIFTTSEDGYTSFNPEIKHGKETYTPWGYFNHLRNDLVLGAMHLTPKENKASDLYTLNDKDYYKLSDIEARTPNWRDLYNVSPTTKTLEDGTIVHTLAYNDPLSIARALSLPLEILLNPDGTYKYSTGAEGGNDPFPKASVWPYAVGAGLLAGSLLYNILKPSDYSNTEALIQAAKLAGTYTPVAFRPVGEYLKYNPFDINYTANQLRASERANARALTNNSNGNIGMLNGSLLANNYNNQIALGNAYRQAFEYNDALRAKTAEFNRGTDEFNSEGFLKADMANQDAATRTAGYKLEGLKSGYAMKLAIDDAKANAINAGLSGLANLAFTYGLQKDYENLLKWRTRRAVDGPGIYYKDEEGNAAKGGKLRRAHKGLSF